MILIKLTKLTSRHFQYRNSRSEVFCKKGVLKNSESRFHSNCRPLAQVFSCEIYKIFKNTFCHGTPPVASSVNTVDDLRQFS